MNINEVIRLLQNIHDMVDPEAESVRCILQRAGRELEDRLYGVASAPAVPPAVPVVPVRTDEPSMEEKMDISRNLSESVKALLLADEFIPAIRQLRQETGLGLKAAKTTLEIFRDRYVRDSTLSAAFEDMLARGLINSVVDRICHLTNLGRDMALRVVNYHQLKMRNDAVTQVLSNIANAPASAKKAERRVTRKPTQVRKTIK